MSNVNYVPEFMTDPVFVEALFSFRQYGDFVSNTMGVLKTVYSLATGNIPPFGKPDETMLTAYSMVLKQLAIVHVEAKKKLGLLRDRASDVLRHYPNIPMQEFHNNTDGYSAMIDQVSVLFTQLCRLLGTKHLNPSDLMKNIGELCVIDIDKTETRNRDDGSDG